VIVADLLIVNFHLPNCKDVTLYNDTLCGIFSSILFFVGYCDISNCKLVFGGDFNLDLASEYPGCHVWNDMMTDLNLIICDLAFSHSLNQCFSRYLEYFRYCYRCYLRHSISVTVLILLLQVFPLPLQLRYCISVIVSVIVIE
jgi:hypothetical protein